jgi:hypothetical protein
LDQLITVRLAVSPPREGCSKAKALLKVVPFLFHLAKSVTSMTRTFRSLVVFFFTELVRRQLIVSKQK